MNPPELGLASREFYVRDVNELPQWRPTQCVKTVSPPGPSSAHRGLLAAERDLPRNAFEGMKGRPPRSDCELTEWLATDEGKQATIFVPTSALWWGEVGRSIARLHVPATAEMTTPSLRAS